MYTIENVKTRLRIAARQLIVNEWLLFEAWARDRPTSERTVCAHLGWYTKSVFPNEWDIDVEYNRSAANRSKRGDDGILHPADLIIHRRLGEGRNNNLLVVELKVTGNAPGGGSKFSVASLMREHKYQYGVLLELNAGRSDGLVTLKPRWTWIQDATESVVKGLQSRAVFSDSTMKTMYAEVGSRRRTLPMVN